MLPPESLAMPPGWRDLLEQLAAVFARRSAYRLFTALACGLILADRGTVTGMAAAAGIGHQWRRACWFFAEARWDADALGLAVARLIVKYLPSEGTPVTVAVDGTFFRRWGRHVFAARRAYDGSAQGGKKTAYGSTWVVAAIVVPLRFCPSPAALPVLFRLWRGKGTASQVELAASWSRCWQGRSPAARFTGRGTPRSTGNPWPSRGQRGRRGCRPAQLLLIREPGSAKPYDLGLFTLDTQAGPEAPAGRYSWRWAIEPSSAAGKQLTGAGGACNRVQEAVERTVPFAFLAQSLMIIWYALACDPAASIGRRRSRCPSYRTKATPAPADMHAALRSELTDARMRGATASPPDRGRRA